MKNARNKNSTLPYVRNHLLNVTNALYVSSDISCVGSMKIGGNISVDGSASITGIINGSISGNAGTVTNPNLTGQVTTSGLVATVANSAVIGKVLTGYTSGAGTVAATDTILQAIQKLDGNVSAGGGGSAGIIDGGFPSDTYSNIPIIDGGTP